MKSPIEIDIGMENLLFPPPYLPTSVREQVDLSSLSLESSQNIDQNLKEVISDVTFRCRFKPGVEGFIGLLVEHQSRAEPLLPFRVYHYIFSVLQREVQAKKCSQLPPMYAMVFYNGSVTPYPYSMSLVDCFADEHVSTMHEWFSNPVPLVDVNDYDTHTQGSNSLAGIMTRAMQRLETEHIDERVFELMKLIYEECGENSPRFIATLIYYLSARGTFDDFNGFIRKLDALPTTVRDEVMTFADELRKEGMQQGIQQGLQEGIQQGMQKGRDLSLKETAMNMLSKGFDQTTVCEITGLSASEVQALAASNKQN